MALHFLALPLEIRRLVIQQLNAPGSVLKVNISNEGSLLEPQRSIVALAKVCHQLRAETIACLCKHPALGIRLEHPWEDFKLEPLKQLPQQFLVNVRELHVDNCYAHGPWVAPIIARLCPSTELIKVLKPREDLDLVDTVSLVLTASEDDAWSIATLQAFGALRASEDCARDRHHTIRWLNNDCWNVTVGLEMTFGSFEVAVNGPTDSQLGLMDGPGETPSRLRLNELIHTHVKPSIVGSVMVNIRDLKLLQKLIICRQSQPPTMVGEEEAVRLP